jgi:excisionase family DNA binding protein
MNSPTDKNLAPLYLDDDDDMDNRKTDLRVRRPVGSVRPTEDLPAILRVEELAKLLRVNRKTAYEAVASGLVPGARRIGRTIRIDRDVVLKWLSGQGCVSRSSRRKR